MDENGFWAMIEAAWGVAGGKAKPRQRLSEGKLSEGRAYALQEVLEEEVVPALLERLDALSADELLEFDRILERKLYDIDRADIQERTDGSDDGFLYCRGFIVGMGRAYYEAVRANPDRAITDAECEQMCYLSWHLYHDKFGEMTPSGISRETCSNPAGWPPDSKPDAAPDAAG
ncbi:DUF4240 domain-containing protein [Gemmata sp. JC673]|uniref:DUF4240 domain-containing protein n=1 Tax=Gemmata algarum TaxID=2975278 RepID=A0ABU5F377_9BACT|nr:DUF4240 domain-containing protein [Gemmata algarum]MDY3560324.1 DUF4240 domain-containing protein [Gemmata algarum]